ncbi:MAG: SGNH/GDSL hydrolase family protein [Thermodesulfobacteriota bacterium]|jgi:lysophospholipase L1-like esterase
MRLFFFGDSICFGQHVSPHKTWVNTVCARLCEAAPGGFVATNASVNGNTTRMALERMPYDVQAHGVDILLVQFGMNDCNCWQTDGGLPRVSPGAFAANLAEIVERGRRFGAAKVFMNTNHPTPRTAPFGHAPGSYQSGNGRYNAIIRSVCAESGAELIDVEAAWLDALAGETALSDLLLPDGIHLSEAGHELYAATVLPPLLEAVSSWKR